MPDYKHGKIYVIRCNKTGRVYVGSTAELLLKARIRCHCTAYTAWKKSKKDNICSSWEIIETGDYTYDVIEHYCCTTKKELELHETKWYFAYKEVHGDLCVNKNVPRHTLESYRKYQRDRKKIDYWDNPEKFRQLSLQWQKDNPEKHRAKCKQWKLNNTEKVKAHNDKRCPVMLKEHNDARKDKVCICEYCHQQKSYASYARHRSLCFAKTCDSMNRINIF